MMFSLNAFATRPITNIEVQATTSLCISDENCIALDTRSILCVSSTCQSFSKGKGVIEVQSEIPVYTPSGSYEVKLHFEGLIEKVRKDFPV